VAGPAPPEPQVTLPADPLAVRDAAGRLLVKLSPQERAAVVLKDVFELSSRAMDSYASSTPAPGAAP